MWGISVGLSGLRWCSMKHVMPFLLARSEEYSICLESVMLGFGAIWSCHCTWITHETINIDAQAPLQIYKPVTPELS